MSLFFHKIANSFEPRKQIIISANISKLTGKHGFFSQHLNTPRNSRLLSPVSDYEVYMAVLKKCNQFIGVGMMYSKIRQNMSKHEDLMACMASLMLHVDQ
jgi:hypothetical protein